MLLIRVFIKALMKKVKISKNSTPDGLFHRLASNSTLIEMFFVCLHKYNPNIVFDI